MMMDGLLKKNSFIMHGLQLHKVADRAKSEKKFLLTLEQGKKKKTVFIRK